MEYLCKCYMPACGNLESGNISDGNNELPFSFKYGSIPNSSRNAHNYMDINRDSAFIYFLRSLLYIKAFEKLTWPVSYSFEYGKTGKKGACAVSFIIRIKWR